MNIIKLFHLLLTNNLGFGPGIGFVGLGPKFGLRLGLGLGLGLTRGLALGLGLAFMFGTPGTFAKCGLFSFLPAKVFFILLK